MCAHTHAHTHTSVYHYAYEDTLFNSLFLNPALDHSKSFLIISTSSICGGTEVFENEQEARNSCIDE